MIEVKSCLNNTLAKANSFCFINPRLKSWVNKKYNSGFSQSTVIVFNLSFDLLNND